MDTVPAGRHQRRERLHRTAVNTYDDGGPLIWFAPAQPVFIDSRYDPYPIEQFTANRQVELTGDYRTLFERYGIKCAIVPVATPTEAALRAAPAWTMTYQDESRAVFAAK